MLIQSLSVYFLHFSEPEVSPPVFCRYFLLAFSSILRHSLKNGNGTDRLIPDGTAVTERNKTDILNYTLSVKKHIAFLCVILRFLGNFFFLKQSRELVPAWFYGSCFP